MNIVKCHDLGFKCDFMAAGQNKEEVEKTIFDHIQNEHRDKLDKMSDDDLTYLKQRVSTLLGRSCGCGAL